MLHYLKKYRYLILFFVTFTAVTLPLFYNALKPQKQLKIYNPADVNPELVDTTVQHVAKYHKIADFKFVNQNGDTITQKDYEGKVYVADFFFTTCPTICPSMTNNMRYLQDATKGIPNVKFLSHSVTPDIDSVAVLKAYALKNGVDDARWNLVTGNKEDIYYIARKSYLAVKTGSPEELYDMVHTENFVLVDEKRQVRGFYDGTKQEDMERLLEDILFLCEKDNKSTSE